MSGITIALLGGLVLAVPAVANPAPASAGSPPAPLTGESLINRPGTDTSIAIACGAEGEPVAGTMTSSGEARGPYPGSYRESATFTTVTREQRAVDDPLLEFRAEFTIESGDTRITGTKTLVTGAGYCDTVGPADGAEIEIVSAAYQARIDTPAGSFTDSGNSEVFFQDRQTTPDSADRTREFLETFLQGQPATTPLPPTDPNQPAQPTGPPTPDQNPGQKPPGPNPGQDPGEDRARQVLSRPPFAPDDRTLFSPQTYGAPPTPPALAPHTESRVRAVVAQTLGQRFGPNSRRFQEAVGVVDDPAITSVAPDIRLRGAIALLAGTHAEDAIRVFREGTFVNIRFGLGVPGRSVAAATLEPGQTKRSIIVDLIYQNEDIRLIPSILSHEAFHSDNSPSSAKEELIASALDRTVYAQFVIEDPSLALQRTELSRRRNTGLLALVNTRDEQGFIRLTTSQGNVYPESLTPLASFAAAFGDYENFPDNPGSRYLANVVKSVTGDASNPNFDLATIDLLDRTIDRAMSAQDWVRVASALRLRLESTPAAPPVADGLPPILQELGIGTD